MIFWPTMTRLPDELIRDVLSGGDVRSLIVALQTPLILFTLTNLLISTVFWYAPAITGFFGTRILQSMFFSAVACWRNKSAFFVYGLTWGAVFLGLDITTDLAVGLLLSMALPASLIVLLQIPINVAAAAVLYCSVLPSYLSVFGRQAVNPPSGG